MTITTASVNIKLPQATKVPVVLQTIQAILDQFGTLERYQKKYGDIFYIPSSPMFPPSVIFSDPKGIEQVFTANPDCFEVGQQLTAPVRVLLGDYSLVLLDGLEHKRQRKLLMPQFHGERMKNYGQTIIEVTQQVIAQWQVGQSIGSSQEDSRFQR
ncbi:MAG TPA: cytochrome P450 [Xenococcaceae cyanobacterium]